MKRKLYGVLLSLCLVIEILLPEYNGLAAENTSYIQVGNSITIKTLDEILKLFEENNPNIKQMRLQYDSKIYEYEEAKEIEEEYQELYVINVGTSDSDTIDSLREQYLSALLNREILSFYVTNRTGLLSYDIQKQKYNFVNMYYKMIVLEKKETYYQANAQYLSLCKSIMNIKYKYGRCTALEVSQIEEQIEENEASLYETQAEFDELERNIKSALGTTVDFSLKIPVNDSSNNYNLSQVVASINKNEFSYEEVLSKEDAYQVCNTCEKAIIGSRTYKKNALLIQQYNLQAKEIESNINTYAMSTISAYKKSIKKLSSCRKKLNNCKSSYTNIYRQYNKGKASKFDVLESVEYVKKTL